MYGDKSIDKPDWLPDDPTSDEAHQMVLNQSETLEQAQITGYMSGYFDGEGSVRANVGEDNTLRLNHEFAATLTVSSAQMSGLFDAEGCIRLSVSNRPNINVSHQLTPFLSMGQNRYKTMIENIFNSYSKHIDFTYNRYYSKQNDRDKEFTRVCINGNSNIKNFLAPLLPMLKEKQEQAIIMLREIIPRMERGVHLNKEGFIELMKWKELLDREKPMSNEDRKYTVEYFQDLWADDLDDDAQSDLTHFQSAHGD
jgi:hypothetical protein